MRLTVKHSLAERHYCCREANDQRLISSFTVHLPAAGKKPLDTLADLEALSARRRHAMIVDNHEIKSVENSLDSIESALRASKTIVALPPWLSVHVIDLSINLVRLPNGPLEPSSFHCVWAK